MEKQDILWELDKLIEKYNGIGNIPNSHKGNESKIYFDVVSDLRRLFNDIECIDRRI